MTTTYAILKHHFDKLLLGGYPPNTGLEPIRDVYGQEFNRKINLYDIYQTPLNIDTNPVSSIVTLLGPNDDKDPLPRGVMQCLNSMVSTNVFSDDIFKGINSEDAPAYINGVYEAMFNVIKEDKFYKQGFLSSVVHGTSSENFCNPYSIALIVAPLYYTWHHCKTCIPNHITDNIFIEILQQIFSSPSKAVDIMERFNRSMEDGLVYSLNALYNIITNNRTDPFWIMRII